MVGDSRLEDEFNIGVVVDVRSAGYHDHLIGHFDILRAGMDVFRRGHANEEEGLRIAEGHIGPATNGAHALHRGNTIVRY